MSGRYLFDTNIIIALFANDIAVGELFYGARKSGRSPGKLKRIEEFIARNTVIGCDVETARQYGVRINCVSKVVHCPKMIFGLQLLQCSII